MSFVVRIKPDNLVFFIEPGENILDAALRQGFEFSYGCQQGSCGTCATKLLEGKVSYPENEPIGLEEDEAAANFILLCSAVAESDLVLQHAGVTTPWQSVVRKIPYRVANMHMLSSTITQLILEPMDEHAIHFQAGQYIELYTPDGEHRPYSIANAPVAGQHIIELHVRHVVENPFSTLLLDNIAKTQQVTLEGPFGHCIYRKGITYPLIFLAGGTGFSHSKALIEQAIQHAPDVPMHLFWGAKTPPDLYMTDLLQRWQQELPAFQYTPTISRSDGTYDWQGHTTSLPQLVTEFYPDLCGKLVYASGPPALVLDALQHFKQHGLKPEFLCSDVFDYIEAPK
ncbi:MAG: 2Fe-2S iron-sulfur cluster-binding protein [Gammaproteobacteria bacterium]